METTEITKQLIQELRPKLNEAVAALGEQYGMSLKFGDARYDSTSATFKLNISLAKTADLDPKAEWDANCARIGMKPEDFGQKIYIKGTSYTICGYNKNARANYVRLRRQDGQPFVTSPADAKKRLAAYTIAVGTIITINAWGKSPERKMVCVGTKHDEKIDATRFVFDNNTEWTWADLNSNFAMWNMRNGYSITNPNAEPKPQVANSTAIQEWKMYARLLGMQEDDLGKHFVFRNSECEIIGCYPRARRYTIICKDVLSGDEFRLDPEDIKMCMRA